jgi:tetratricopeptide (TPR) repeat protein
MAQNQYDQADQLLARISIEKPSLETQALLRTLGDWNAINGRWPRAIERFALLIKLDPLDASGVTLDHFRLAAALIESGRRDDYERLRQDVVSRFGGTTNARPDRLLKCWLLLPASQPLLQSLQCFAQAAEEQLANGPASRSVWTSSALALMEYRQGNDARAAALSTRCLTSLNTNSPLASLARVILALACCRLHQFEEARAALDRAQQRIDLAFNTGLSLNLNNDSEHWFDWVLARILFREAQEELLRAVPSKTSVDK